ncbi:putative spermidine/putrescine transport system ATP-binding protein [Tistlia consotensis]|uniref:Putative spermidine/putrescine transport system ATP-binding protein n=1 Tax=Tistlia consotensis USBA 355 TaxID=560819 RepID=A0A1Y6CIR4_9PROT|nr:ABC transporter ATP-binding protein [Tistlia consotensis]SMF57039.1 putative spermidine/putrescine transport system ATP-binding protein [Tistlia consotensis USBA 355]SNR45270.1 putative spermidine/putrescine transport system ATP-binding protein [Tistlia consotensis]
MTDAPPRQPKLVVDGLAKSYGPVVALEPTRLDVQPGEFLTLLGPSGSGKTTLLQLIAGLVEPDAGRILIDGRDETRTPVHRRDIGLVFQHYALFPHLTVSENVGFPLRMRGCRARALAERVEAALAMVRLDHLKERFPRELSGGQQQRVALARCFVYQPSVILMDEPLGALDKKLREHMQIEIKRLHRESAATIVYVTHDQEEALALSDRICLMNHARVEQTGVPQEIYAHPRSAFAADFIGLSNIFRGRVERSAEGRPLLATPAGRFLFDGAAPGAEASLVVRPEHLTLEAEPKNGVAAPALNRVAGEVAELVYAGSETRVLIALPDGAVVTVRLAPDAALPRLGQPVTACWRPEAAVLVP